MTVLSTWIIALFLATAGDGTLAAAAPAAEQARAHFDAGLAQADAQHFNEALLEFNRAYATYPHYAVLYNVAQCLVRLGDLPRAMETFDSYLSQGASDVPPARLNEVLSIQRGHTTTLGILFVAANQTGATVRIDGAHRGELPLGRRLWLTSGTHILSISKPGFESYEETVSVGAGQEVRISVTLHAQKPELHTGQVQFDCAGAGELTVVVDDKRLALGPTRRLSLSEGLHSIALPEAGQSQVGAVLVKPDQTVHYACPPIVPEVNLLTGAETAVPGPDRTRYWRHGTCGAGALLLASAATMAVWDGRRYGSWKQEDAALDQASEMNSLPIEQLRSRTEKNDQQLRSIQRFDLVAAGLAVLGLASATACGVLTIRHYREGEH